MLSSFKVNVCSLREKNWNPLRNNDEFKSCWGERCILQFECIGYLDHGHVFLWRSWLNLARHLDHSFDQSCHVLVHFVIGAVQVGGGGRAYLLGLQLSRESTKSNEWLSWLDEQRQREQATKHRKQGETMLMKNMSLLISKHSNNSWIPVWL